MRGGGPKRYASSTPYVLGGSIPQGTVGYFGVPYQINTFYPMFYGNIYLFGTWGLSINIWMTNFDEGALWLLVYGLFLFYY